ncbi:MULTISPECIES: hypothetical protein [Massilia]|uniref:Uncharacterized protein n=1 Tax=Massilia haematophila TaxID=457923 RepID=A0ABV7PGM1_9BURK|nr:hypothetical protein [Massilia sp.]
MASETKTAGAQAPYNETVTNAAAAGTAGQGGLASVTQVVELADQLSACADQLHERIMGEIRAYEGATVPEHVQAAARALFDDEVILRQRANSLYADAATYTVKSLGKSQKVVIALTAEAAEKIRKITRIAEVSGLVAGLLHLAGAAATGQPASILAALDKIRAHAQAVEATRPPGVAPSAAETT